MARCTLPSAGPAVAMWRTSRMARCASMSGPQALLGPAAEVVVGVRYLRTTAEKPIDCSTSAIGSAILWSR
eukprot:2357702-Prymnesium_polylepis.3